MILKREGFTNLSSIFIVVVLPFSWAAPITFACFILKVQQRTLYLEFLTPGEDPDYAVLMLVIEMLFCAFWITSMAALMLWYFLTTHVSPFKVENPFSKNTDKKTVGVDYWKTKKGDDYLKYV